MSRDHSVSTSQLTRTASHILQLEQQINLALVAIAEWRRLADTKSLDSTSIIIPIGQRSIVDEVCDAVQSYFEFAERRAA